MRRYMRRGMTGREKRRLLLFLVCAALIALAVTAMTQLRPILTSLATARVSNAVTRVVNTSVNETLYDAGVDYDRLISLEKDNEGHITAVKSNMAEFNRLQSAVLADVLQRLSEVSTRELKKVLQECVDAEDKRKPLTDEQLVVEMGKHGYKVARRTIAKYRGQLGIPLARWRKEL